MQQLRYDVRAQKGVHLSAERYLPLESSMMTLLVLLVSSILDKCPDPEPKSRIVLNFLLMSYTRTFKQRILDFENICANQ